MKKLFLYIMFAAVGLGLQSCLHDNDEIFEQSAAERINTAIESAEKVLTSAEKGWVMHYYLGHDYTYGGINITMSFKNGKVTMREAGVVDAAGEYVALTSTYKLTRIRDQFSPLIHIMICCITGVTLIRTRMVRPQRLTDGRLTMSLSS